MNLPNTLGYFALAAVGIYFVVVTIGNIYDAGKAAGRQEAAWAERECVVELRKGKTTFYYNDNGYTTYYEGDVTKETK